MDGLQQRELKQALNVNSLPNANIMLRTDISSINNCRLTVAIAENMKEKSNKNLTLAFQLNNSKYSILGFSM